MRAVAVVVEYNPLHNGHLHHLSEVKKLFPDAAILAIMSGNFLQRGEPALIDKYIRAKWAVLSGCDIVLELPFAFSTQRADVFAKGAVTIANAFGASALIFGQEDAVTLNDSPADLQPNQRLGYFYMKAIFENNLAINPIGITRLHSTYNADIIEHNSIASATAIRKLMMIKQPITQFVPSYVAVDLKTCNHRGLIANYYPFLKYSLINQQAEPTALSQFGLWENFCKNLEQTDNFADFFELSHHKHTSRTHIQRALTYLLCNATQAILDEAILTPWTRILALSDVGQQYYKQIKSQLTEFLVSTTIKQLSPANYTLQYNSCIAYSLITQNDTKSALILEHQHRPYIYNDKEEKNI